MRCVILNRKMMPIKGLSVEDTTLNRRQLQGKGGHYLSAALLCIWDNIHGPKILSAWSRDQQNEKPPNTAKSTPSPIPPSSQPPQPSPPPSSQTLLSVAIHSLNNEPGRTERITGIESKFFVMEKYSIIAGAFIFTIEINHGRPEVFSFILVLPHSELQEYLMRFAFYEERVQQLLQKYLIDPLIESAKAGAMSYRTQSRLKEHVLKEVVHMDRPIQNLAQLMHSLRYYCLPSKCSIQQTLLGAEMEMSRKFLEYSITCHLQCSGHTIVVGEDAKSVNMMLRTLGVFLSDQERKLSRLTTTLPPHSIDEDDDIQLFNYEPNLYLQGFIVSGESSYLPFSMADIRQSHLPPCIIYFSSTCKEVRWVEMNIPYFIRVKDDNEKKSRKSLDFRDLLPFKEYKEYSSRLVTEFIDRMRLLPVEGGVREAFVFQFLHHLKLKALALSKYVDAAPKSHTGDQIVGVLALNRGVTSDKSHVNRDTLQQDLSLDCDGDLHVVLAFAEKIRTNTYFDVLGDPQTHSEAVIREFEAL